jgi:hypothetical protein
MSSGQAFLTGFIGGQLAVVLVVYLAWLIVFVWGKKRGKGRK